MPTRHTRGCLKAELTVTWAGAASEVSGWAHACSVTQLCLTLRDPMDRSPPGSSVQGFSRQEDWSGLTFPPPGGLPDQGSSNWCLRVSCAGRWMLYHQHRLGSPSEWVELQILGMHEIMRGPAVEEDWCLSGSKVWRPGLERNQWGGCKAEAMEVSRNPEGPSQRPSRTTTSREELHVLRNQDEDKEIPTGWSYTEAIRQESFTGKGRRKVWGMGERFYRTEPALQKLQHSTKQQAVPRERWELKNMATNTVCAFWPWTLRNGLPSGAAGTALVPVKTQ